MIDVRSDTVTQPTPAMLEAMLQAEVGDDVFGEDETVNELQRAAAELFAKEAALFCPTGTMSNQVGIKVHTQPGDEVICDELSHIYLNEGGGIAANSGASVRLLRGHNGRFTAEQVRDNINRRDDSHLPWTRLVAVENTVNKGGGSCWDLRELERIHSVCAENDMAMHLDGARLFNASAVTGLPVSEMCRKADTVMFCLSKALGAPVGSMLAGPRALIDKGRLYRKRLGGGMRQAGILAAAGLIALEVMPKRLFEDHANAKLLAEGFAATPNVQAWPESTQTNIIVFDISATGLTRQQVSDRLKDRGVLINPIGARLMRAVTHYDVSRDQCLTALEALREVVAAG
jgi:threonine aldolase